METSTRSCNNFYLSQMLPSPSAIRKSLSFFDKYPASFPGIISHGSSGTLSTDPAPFSIPNPGESGLADCYDWLFGEGGNGELPFDGGGKSSDSRVVPDSFCSGGNGFSGNPFGTISIDPAPFSIPNPFESWFADYYDWLFDEGGNGELPFGGGGKSSDSRVVPDSFCPGGNEFSGNPFGTISIDPAPFSIPNPGESGFADCYDGLFGKGGNGKLPFGGGGKLSYFRVVPGSFCPGGNGFFGNGGNGKLPFGGGGGEEAWEAFPSGVFGRAKDDADEILNKLEEALKKREEEKEEEGWLNMHKYKYAKKKMEEEDSGGQLDSSMDTYLMVRNPMSALFKFVTGAMISSYRTKIRELHKRGKGFLAEFPQYAAGLLFGMVSNISLLDMLAPYVRYCLPFASIGNLGGLQHPSTALPSSAFGAAYERISDLLELLREFKEAWYVCKFAVKQIVRFRSYKDVMLALTCGYMAGKVPPVVMSAALLVAVFFVAINHIIDGLKEASPVVEKVTPAAIPSVLGAKRFPPVAVTFRAGAQFANDAYDAMQYGYSGLHGVRRMNAQSFLYMYLSLTTTFN